MRLSADGSTPSNGTDGSGGFSGWDWVPMVKWKRSSWNASADFDCFFFFPMATSISQKRKAQGHTNAAELPRVGDAPGPPL